MSEEKIHLPEPSFWPLILAIGAALIAIGILTTVIISGIGIVLLIASIIGWSMENRADEMEAPHHD